MFTSYTIALTSYFGFSILDLVQDLVRIHTRPVHEARAIHAVAAVHHHQMDPNNRKSHAAEAHHNIHIGLVAVHIIQINRTIQDDLALINPITVGRINRAAVVAVAVKALRSHTNLEAVVEADHTNRTVVAEVVHRSLVLEVQVARENRVAAVQVAHANQPVVVEVVHVNRLVEAEVQHQNQLVVYRLIHKSVAKNVKGKF